MKLKIRAILTIGLFGFCAALAQAQTAQEFVLKNGMKVVVKEDRRAPTAVQMVWYKVGSVDELNGTTGISHALEHMMFKGTKRHKAGEFSRLVAEMGGRENAFTANDYTAYFQQIEKSHLEAVMALEADRMANLQFDAGEFAKEIRVVMEERRWRTDDQPMGLLHEALNAVAWTAHPYRHPVVGWMDDLQHMTVQDIAAWYRQWYAPNNATLVVAGDVDARRVLALANKYFGKIPPHALPPGKPQNEPQQLGMRRVTVKAPAENPYVVLGFKVPGLRDVEQDQEAYALDVLSAVLDGYENARLTASLVRTGNKATAVGADYSGVARGPVLFTLEGSPAEGVTTEQLEGLLRAEVERIARDGVSPQELQRVKTQLIASQTYKRDSVFGQAMEIGMMETTGIGQKNIDRIIDRLKTVTPEQVQAVAQKYFKDDNLTVATLVPLPLDGKKPAPPPPGMLH
ncbi:MULTISPECIES: pitrilysin family protein [unclassified Herbaspirillum]|uniref:M16 family metallopeptidase n=1 Tax=unclassified Herbaspirillum TaxID=2624150 RepID=UPI0011533BC8|nr:MULTISPECIES: pitrilysin family protein [unclassified Herbaspirillum]MBB5390366.1 zinc protease [Herbaspirillum sp. SJZ102]TQK09137.1 zinc protease [Herbaspirillum sp. SJZ130]TQK14176.1 zinc protease [Herbaspirillum sp. SJZ106]TWC69875.1 zinc protease [Herbaspirillum sp. SJZ099]